MGSGTCGGGGTGVLTHESSNLKGKQKSSNHRIPQAVTGVRRAGHAQYDSDERECTKRDCRRLGKPIRPVTHHDAAGPRPGENRTLKAAVDLEDRLFRRAVDLINPTGVKSPPHDQDAGPVVLDSCRLTIPA